MRLDYHVLQIAIVIHQVIEVFGQSGEWAPWGPWSECSVTCGYGSQRRQKAWRPRDQSGNNKKDFYYTDILECVVDKPCPIDGSWGFWGPWSECTKMCDNGTTTRKKICNAPVPQYGGQECEGRDYATTSCNVWACPELPPNFDIKQCNETTFMCLSGKQCIPEHNRCDNTLQCHDGSDEHDCFYYVSGTNDLSILHLFWTITFTLVVATATS